MKKISNFIVKFRYAILLIVIALAGISLGISQNVKVNHDLTKYMPESSETSQGNSIMEQEFSEVETSTLSVMFDDLGDEQKSEIKTRLENIDGVKSVAHDDSEDHNKDNHTLYTITVDDAADSELASKVFDEIDSTYHENYTIHYSGDVASNNAEVVSIVVIIIAIAAAMIILIILCDSFIEPFLFLFTIGLAVFINAGTNIIFPEISHITKAIAAILQLALSMDYSIMLMNRYRQEKLATKAKTNAEKQAAMKAALAHSFSSISSSSITTVVGLFVLVFMSFTIGRDMGLIMSKGVILSLFTIFTCLPGLILLFDPLIEKTTKKHSINPKMTWAGNLAYKFRFAAPIVFLVILIGSFFLKGNVAITYTGSENDVIGEIFPKTNQIAIIYQNQDEEKITNFCRSAENNEKNKQVLCYGNTIDEPKTVNNLTAKLSDLGEKLDVEDYLLRFVYYHYYNPDESHKMTVNDFVNFVKSDILTNPTLAKHVSDSTNSQLTRLSNFTDSDKLYQARTIDDLANILEIDSASVKDLLVLYQAKNPTDTLTISEAINFIVNDIYGSSYESELSSTIKSKISAVLPYTNRQFITTAMDAPSIAATFGLDESTVAKLLFYREYITRTDTDLTMSISDLLTLLSTDPTLQSQMSSNPALGAALSDPNTIATLIGYFPDSYDYTTMAANLNYALSSYNITIPAELIKSIYLYRADEIAAASAEISPYDFVSFILGHAADDALAGSIDDSTIATLSELYKIMTAVVNETRFTAVDLADFLGVNSDSTKLLYSYYHYLYVDSNPTLSLYDTVNFMLSDIVPSEKYSNRLTSDQTSKLQNLNAIIGAAIANTELDHTGLYQLLSPLSNNIETKTVDVAYIYHGSQTAYDESWTMTVESFVNYLNDNILADTRLTNLIDDTKKSDITKAKSTITDARRMLIGQNYSRAILNTTLEPEGDETFNYIKTIKSTLNDSSTNVYVIGNSPMALEMSETFNDEMNLITILTMVAIFVVVAFTFRSIIIPLVLVLIIQTAVWITMATVSFTGEPLYFISLIIVQSILMGATIDYAILYTSYYLENRRAGESIKTALINSYAGSIHTILCSASVLIIVTAIVGNLASAIAAKICVTISEGTFFSALLILIILPALLAAMDKLIIRRKK